MADRVCVTARSATTTAFSLGLWHACHVYSAVTSTAACLLRVLPLEARRRKQEVVASIPEPHSSIEFMHPSPTPIEHLIALNHGIDGSVTDMHAVRAALGELNKPGVEVWETTANTDKTREGVLTCAERYWTALAVKLGDVLGCPENSAASSKLRISFVGHSMGALVLRAVAAKLHASELTDCVKFDTLVCISSPHLGTRRLGHGAQGGVAPLIRGFAPPLMRASLRVLGGQTGKEFLLEDDTLDILCDEQHCVSLRRFRRRCNYCEPRPPQSPTQHMVCTVPGRHPSHPAPQSPLTDRGVRSISAGNGSGDWIVNPETGSLLTAEEQSIVMPLSLASCRQADSGVLWNPDAHVAGVDAAWPQTIRCGSTHAALTLEPLPAHWDPTPTALAHTTWDDHGGQRCSRVVAMLRQMRECGAWQLYLCHFLEKSSFAGGLLTPHIDLVDLPHKVTQHFGAEVVRHLAELFLEATDGVST